MISLSFTKMHGLGNDYIYINCINNPELLEYKDKIPEIAKYLSNRNFGIGGDGIILINKSEVADFKMNIYNADGSEAQMCGNGIRCFAKYVYDNKLISKDEIKIETLAGIKIAYIGKAQMNKNIQEVTVDMGTPIFEVSKIPVIADNVNNHSTITNLKLNVLEQEIEMFCVSMGNPHAVIFCKNVDEINLHEIGPIIENDKHFPERTNVEFIQVLNNSNIKMRVWERGSGETFACGTGACASSVVCSKLGYTRRQVKVHLKGGDLKIYYDEINNKIYMTGTATKVFEGKIELSV